MPYADAHSNSHTDTNSYADGNANGNTHTHAYTNNHPNAHAYAYGNANDHTNANAYTYADADNYTNTHKNPNANANNYTDTNEHTDANTNAYAHANSYADAYADAGPSPAAGIVWLGYTRQNHIKLDNANKLMRRNHLLPNSPRKSASNICATSTKNTNNSSSVYKLWYCLLLPSSRG
jgi:hypothetical protein